MAGTSYLISELQSRLSIRNILRGYVLCLWYFLSISSGHGQVLNSGSIIAIKLYQIELSAALAEVSSISGVNIVFSPDMIPDRIVNIDYQGRLENLLSVLLHDTGLVFRELEGQVVLYRDARASIPFVVSGYIEDNETGERLTAAHVQDLMSGAGAVTNEYGFFNLHSRGRHVILKASYLGYDYDTLVVDRTLASNTQIVKLKRLLVLGVVTIEEEHNRNLNFEPLRNHRFTERQLESRTYLGGEQDVQRYIETLPGVSIGTDGIGGMHVRGGNGDQNLVLFDGVPIYHSTHAIGLLSVFNPFMIREVNLLKGEFPARYAGRLSSVLDVKTREGNNRHWSVRAGIGTATVNALIEGPLIREKVGLLIAARRFVPGFYLRDLSAREKSRNGLVGHTEYGFTDVNAKCNIALSDKNRVFLSFYHGDDKYRDTTNAFTPNPQGSLSEAFSKKLNWGNSVGVMRWNHQLGLHVFANTTFTLSSYELQSHDYVNFQQILPSAEITGFTSREFKSRIRDAAIKFDIDHFLSNKNRLRYGLMFTRHIIEPKSIVFDDAAQIDDFYIDEGTLDDRFFSELRTEASEAGVYVESYADIGSVLTISGGLHLSAFDVENTTYWSLQPRLNLHVQMLSNLHGHASANTMTQYMHLLTSSGIGLPTDLWVPSTSTVRPESATQFSAGLSWQILPQLTWQVDAYHKTLRNLVAYREGASFLLREGSIQTGILDAANWEDKVTQGRGEAYGIESMITLKGKWCHADLAYTYARAQRQFDHDNDEEDLNFGAPFPFRFDRRHALSVSGVVHISDRLQLSVSWNYADGTPITLAESKFQHPSSSPVFPPVEVLEFSEYNAFRLPDYHRMDLGLKYRWKRPKATHSLHLDIYNVYDRRNVLYLTLVQDGDAFKNQRFTVLPVIPSLSYQIKI